MNTNYHKQKYYCQICLRQCQDRDGFNCHLKSKTHEKNIEAIAKQPEEYINGYSWEFEKGYLDIMKRLYPDQWVSANKVYEEYMHDKDSVPLNMTKWESLNKVILHLTKANKCRMNASESDIYLQYIDNSIIKSSKDISSSTISKKTSGRSNKEIEEIAKYNSNTHQEKKKEYGKVNIEDMKGLEIELKKNKVYLNNKRQRDSALLVEEKEGEDTKNEVNDINEEDDIWISKGLIVRIEDKELEKGKHYKLKGKIINTNEYLAEVELKKSHTKITIDQYYLSTVIPSSIESPIYIIKGKHKSHIGLIQTINKDKGFATIQIKGHHNTIHSLPFSHICKYKNK